MKEEEFKPQEFFVAQELILQLIEGSALEEKFVLRHPFDGLASVNNNNDLFCDLSIIRDLFNDLKKNLYLMPDAIINWSLIFNKFSDSESVEKKQDFFEQLIEVFST